MRILASLVFILSILFIETSGQIIHIPADYPTIQEGINAASEGDTVLVAPGTYFENITFRGINITLASHFLMTGDTSYISSTIIDGNHNGCVLTIMQHENSDMRISGFSITNGISTMGGGIYISSADPLLDNLLLYENSANLGGGIYLSGSNTIIKTTAIKNNSAESEGGGIYSNASVRLIKSRVIGNSAVSGGGISVHQSIRLDTTEIIDNKASQDGGGIYCHSSSHTELYKTVVKNNSALRYGGGIDDESNAIIKLHGSTISNNLAGNAGGGISWWGSINTYLDSINRNNIYLNRASTGNDLFSYSDSAFVIVDTFTVVLPTEFHTQHFRLFDFDIIAGKLDQVDEDLFVSPAGDNNNTGLTPDNPLKTIGRAFQKIRSDCTHQPTVHLANGVYSPSTTGEIFPIPLINRTSLAGESRDSTVLDAESTASVISLQYDTIESIRNLTITGGLGIFGGGGIWSYHSPVYLDNIRITGNRATADFDESAGGGIKISFTGLTTLSNMIIEENVSDLGGGMSIDHSNLDFVNVEFKNNLAVNGGGIYMEYLDSVRFDKVKFLDNKATQVGGGICANYTLLFKISNSFICSNTGNRGAGMSVSYSSPLVTNTLISGNVASQYGGGVILYFKNDYSPLINSAFINVTFSDNSFPGLYSFGTGLRLVNSIFWGNDNLFQVHFDDGGAFDTLSILNTDIQGGMDGIYLAGPPSVGLYSENLNEDPQFLLSGDYPYSLSEGSPCIDAGTPDTTGLYLPFNDIIGNTRIWDGDGDGVPVIDMGPYEYGAPLTVPCKDHSKSLNSGDVYIYPNPASDHLTIGSSENLTDRTVIFINSTGQVVQSAIIPEGQEILIIDLDGFSQGLYTLIFSDEKGIYGVKKVVIVN